MTPTQLSLLKAAAMADQTAAALLAAGNDTGLAEWFNAPQSFIVWRSALTPDLSRAAITQGAAQLDALTVGKRDSLFYITAGNLDVSNAAIRAAIDDLCGTQATLKGFLQAAQKRPASRAEKLLATGTGTDASPAVMGWEGYVSIDVVSEIRVSA